MMPRTISGISPWTRIKPPAGQNEGLLLERPATDLRLQQGSGDQGGGGGAMNSPRQSSVA